MKKLLIILSICFIICGCSGIRNTKKDIIDKYGKIKGYSLVGDLSISNNDDVYNYKVEVGYKSDDYYKVVLTNKSNSHKQIILKNDDGVFVLTPSLNKSFKFNSDWPYDNSQVYLLDTIVNDIKEDSDSKVKNKDDKYIIDTKVNYSNNSSLVKQRLVFNKKLKLERAVVYNDDGVGVIEVKFKSIKLNPKFNKDYFKLDKMVDKNNNITKRTSSLDDTLYPLFLPSDTKLVDEEKINKGNGERVIMTFGGDKSFLLVEETTNVFNEFTVIPTSGEPFQLLDTMGIISNNSLSWTSGNTDYYLVSDVMSQDEMIEVARSIGNVKSLK